MFFDPEMTYSSSSNQHLGLNDEESETLRLKNLLQENILKVERENMETIQKDILNQKTELNSKNLINNAQEKVPKVSANKSSVSLKRGPISLHAKSPQIKKDSNVKSSTLPSNPGCQTTASSCPFSNVHFLNHFQSSYLASKPANRIKLWNEVHHFTSLDPPERLPIQKALPIQSHTNEDCPKPAVHDKKRIVKNLTMQALPSITINGEKTNFKRNVLMEELKEKNHSTANCIKTTVMPTVHQENKIKFKTKQVQETVITGYYTEKGVQVSGQPTGTVCTQTTHDSKDGAVNKEYVKELVREVLEEFKLESYRGLHLESAEKESKLIPCRNDCELDSFIGNTTPKICDESALPRSTTKYTISTQTNRDSLNMEFDKAQMKDLMKEIIHEYKQAAPVNVTHNKNIQCFIPEVMVYQETQTDKQECDVSSNRGAVSTAVQVSLLPEKPNFCEQALSPSNDPPAASDSIDNSGISPEKNTCSILPEASISKEPPSVFPAELSTRLEFVINSLYEHLRKDNQTPDISPIQLSSPKTTETSVQSDPTPTSNRGTCTDEIPRVNSAIQSDPFFPPPPPSEKKKLLIHASVQSETTRTPPRGQVDSSAQCDECPRVASRDVCLQTFETFRSEGSTNTSVSSTPVSDSMFLDDMLSEGEVFLPWNLRLLSHSDKSQLQSSSNIAAEDSCSSDKEKDYSLSEGEIPPNYFQQVNRMSSPCDSGSDSSRPTVHQSGNILCQKSPLQTNPIGPSSSHYRCETPNSTFSEGEVRNSSTLFEGQILIYSKQPKRPFTPQTVHSSVPSDANFIRPNAMCSQASEFNVVSPLESSQKLHSSSDLSEGEIKRQLQPGSVNKPWGLFTLREEK